VKYMIGELCERLHLANHNKECVWFYITCLTWA
jgi:hypothetical protein